jgi:lysyl-tRNA synthetase class 2
MRSTGAPLSYARRVAVWDAVLAAVRDQLRGQGLREVSTPVRVRAPAIEPYIEPIAAPPGFLATSPELAMKRLLCRGSGPIFQLSHVFRQAERGDRHSEEFHLLEWYRLDDELGALEGDVEAIVARVFAAVGEASQPPRRWRRDSFFEVFAATTGVALRGDEDDGQLREAVPAALREAVWDGRPGPLLGADPEVRALAAWTGLFGVWSDRHLDPWLMQQRDVGVHIGEFPAALAALSRRSERGGRAIAHRVESHVGGVELANGYLELRDASEQRARFIAVNALREALGAAALPLDEEFLAELAAPPGLPACAGVALGLDRLVMLACGRSRLSDVTVALGAA